MSKTIGSTGLSLIKKFEGCRLTAYKDTVAVWTIGYGHTGTVDGKAISEGMTITQSKAESLLISDCQKFASYVDNSSYVPITNSLNDNQRDALISFAFNLGQGNLKKVCAGRTAEQIAKAIPQYCNAGGKKLQGLVNRRAAEVVLFNTSNPSVQVASTSNMVNTDSRFVVGSCVVYSSYYNSSTDDTSKAKFCNPWKNGVITKIKSGAKNPYAISDKVGGVIRCWCNSGDFR